MSVEQILKVINRESKSFLIKYVFGIYPLSSYDAEKKIMGYFLYNHGNSKDIELFRKRFPSLSHGSIEDYIENSLYYFLKSKNKEYFIPENKKFIQDIAEFALGYAAKEKISMLNILGNNKSTYITASILMFLGTNQNVSITDLIESLDLKWGLKTRHLERLDKYGYIEFTSGRFQKGGNGKFEKTTIINITEKGIKSVSEIINPIFDYNSNYQYFKDNQQSFSLAMDALQRYLRFINYGKKENREEQILRLLKSKPMTRKEIMQKVGGRVYYYLDELVQEGQIHVNKTSASFIFSA